jgi:hypothetical protein
MVQSSSRIVIHGHLISNGGKQLSVRSAAYYLMPNALLHFATICTMRYALCYLCVHQEAITAAAEATFKLSAPRLLSPGIAIISLTWCVISPDTPKDSFPSTIIPSVGG